MGLAGINLRFPKVSFQFVGNHLNAVAAVIDQKADLGFVFNETWAGLAEPSRVQLQVLAESRDGQAFHCFMVSPDWADKRQEIQEVLCRMNDDPAGRKVLDDLHFTAFEPISHEDLLPLVSFID